MINPAILLGLSRLNVQRQKQEIRFSNELELKQLLGEHAIIEKFECTLQILHPNVIYSSMWSPI